MVWQVTKLDSGLGKYRDDWDRLNREIYDGHLLFDSCFFDLLLNYFGTGEEYLCICSTPDNIIDGLLIVRKRRKGIWSLFLPSQAQIVPVFLKRPEKIIELFHYLPGVNIVLELLNQDPVYTPDWSLINESVILRQRFVTTINIDINTEFQNYWKSRSKNLQKNIKRYLHRIAKKGDEIRLDAIVSDNDLIPALTRYGDMESTGWKGKQGTAIHINNRQGKFYSALLEKYAKSERLIIYELYIGDKLVASRLCLHDDNTLVILKTTYDEHYSSLAPGKILLYLLLNKVHEDGCIKRVEFYTNATSEQITWSTAQRGIEHISIFRIKYIRSIYRLIKNRNSIFINRRHDDSEYKFPGHGKKGQRIPDSTGVPAVVVGMCGHGLALTRALCRSGVRVIGLSVNRNEPGARTNSAEIIYYNDLDGQDLIKSLIHLHRQFKPGIKPPLFLTNDNMVDVVGRNLDQVTKYYNLCWSSSSSDILDLLDKEKIEKRCGDVGLNYPKSYLLSSLVDLDDKLTALEFPIIVKPVKPLSRFKVFLAYTKEDIADLMHKYKYDLPFLAQQYISGDDRKIYFGALYLKSGQVLSRFEGHKLFSRPMGHTTLAEPIINDDVHDITAKFFQGLSLSGPVSLEVKRDNNGRMWVIEPTIGRTDFWVDLCIKNGVNIPLIEYEDQVGMPVSQSRQLDKYIWVNSERDHLGYLRLLMLQPGAFFKYRPSFLYMSIRDIRPFLKSTFTTTVVFFAKVRSKLSKVVISRIVSLSGHSTKEEKLKNTGDENTYVDLIDIENLTEDHKLLHEICARRYFDLSFDWFLLTAKYAINDGEVSIYVARDHSQPESMSILPLMKSSKNAKHLSSLSTYYTSLYAPVQQAGSDSNSLLNIFNKIRSENYNSIRLYPMELESPEYNKTKCALREAGWYVYEYYCFGNWYMSVKDLSFDEYYQKLPTRLRNTIKRKGKKFYNTLNGKIEIITSEEKLGPVIHAYEEVYNNSWKNPEPHSEFIPSLIRLYASKGELRLGLAYIDNIPVATQIWIVHGNKASIFKLAHDKKYSDLSIGSILTAHLMKYVIQTDKVQEIDYLIGDDPYKKDWMHNRRERWGIIAYNPGTLPGLLGITNESIRRILKSVFPFLSGKR